MSGSGGIVGREIHPGAPDDDRQDTPKRDRIDELVASWHSAVERLDRRYRIIAWRQTVTSVLIVGLVIFGILLLKRTNHATSRTTASLCALRHDLEQRVSDGEAFLIDHPRGIPGIPAKTLRQSIDGQRRTIRALRVVQCDA
jgi:hypothetical protein